MKDISKINWSELVKRIRSEHFPHNHLADADYVHPIASATVYTAENALIAIKLLKASGVEIGPIVFEEQLAGASHSFESALKTNDRQSARALWDRFERAVDRAISTLVAPSRG